MELIPLLFRGVRFDYNTLRVYFEQRSCDAGPVSRARTASRSEKRIKDILFSSLRASSSSVERLIRIEEVGGPIPPWSTKNQT